jgi:hypothetical protein
MLTRRLCLALVATSMLVSPGFAQTACKPEALNAAVDAYAEAPFDAPAWRKLTGLGDPKLEGGSYDYESYNKVDEWRKLVGSISPGNETLDNPGYNCRIGYPLEVLQTRIAAFGKTSDYVTLWLKGQAQVLRACAGEAGATLAEDAAPGSLKPDQITLLKQDLNYQQASILFYSNPQGAIPEFKAIAASASPHKAAAHYNVANIMANAKNVVGARAEAKAILADASLASVHDITRELLGYISNIEDTPQGWSALIDGTVETLSQPLPAVTANDKSKSDYIRALYDIGYAGVTNKKDDWWVTNTLPADATLSKALADSARNHPMVLWMMAGQSINNPYTQAPWALVGDKWLAWSTSYVERAMALQPTPLPALPKRVLESLKAKTDDASRAALWSQALDAASKAGATCGDAPDTAAVTLLTLQAVRVSALANRYDEIYTNIPKLKLDGSKSLRETILPKLMQHILAKGNVEEGRRLRDTLLGDAFMQGFNTSELNYQRDTYAQFMAWVAEDEAQWTKAVALMGEKLSPRIFNFLPASKLRELGDNSMFSAEQRGLLKRAAWVRNFATGAKNSDKTTADMFAANPELLAARDAVTKEFPSLRSDRVLLLTILRNPRFGILLNSPDYIEPIETKRDVFSALDDYDANDKNWWCPLEPDRQLGALRVEFDNASDMDGVKDYDGKALAPLLEDGAIAKVDAARETELKQHPMVKAVNWREFARLAKAPSAPQLLARSAITWAKASKGNDGAPEALALAVRATRYGCRWHGSVKAYSKPAQELLKAKFATSTWAAQTPYWFDCVDLQYDAQYNKIASCKPRTWKKQELPR